MMGRRPCPPSTLSFTTVWSTTEENKAQRGIFLKPNTIATCPKTPGLSDSQTLRPGIHMLHFTSLSSASLGPVSSCNLVSGL